MNATPGSQSPPAKVGWDHSDMVLVHYREDPELDRGAKWSIAYFHYHAPFDPHPHWVDFSVNRGAPDFWWPLPEVPQ